MSTTHITDEQLGDWVKAARPYTVVILRPGPQRDIEGAERIVFEHGRRNAELQLAGVLPIVCPVGDDTVSGVGIFDRTPEQTRELMDGDPGVQAGVFRYEIHTCHSLPGSQLP